MKIEKKSTAIAVEAHRGLFFYVYGHMTAIAVK